MGMVVFAHLHMTFTKVRSNVANNKGLLAGTRRVTRREYLRSTQHRTICMAACCFILAGDTQGTRRVSLRVAASTCVWSAHALGV